MKKGITKVPNGPLIKKKGPYAGSTLRSGGKIKKAMNGTTTTQTTTPVKKTWQQMTQAERAAIKTNLGPEKFKKYKDSVSADASNRANAMFEKNAATRGMTVEELRKSNAKDARKPDVPLEGTRCIGKDNEGCAKSAGQTARRIKREARRKNGGKVMKNGGKTPAWQRKEGKSPSGGLNAKGRASLKAAGHDIKPPQPGGGPRKKSFCARMSGMKKKLTSAKTANDPNSRINKSLRKWKC